jgi:ferrous iron transport protein A
MVDALSNLIPIHFLRAGEIAKVVDVLGRPEHVHRLQELGMRSGVDIEMVQPGAPCIVRLTGQTLCFRADDLLRIVVRPTVAA